MSSRSTNGRDRVHEFPGRHRAVNLRFTAAEYDAIVHAAGLAGLTATGFTGEAALAAARGADAPSTAPMRQALVEVMNARTQVRRYAVNVNQAVAQLNGLGEAPLWLAAAVEATTKAVGRLDETAEVLATATRQRRRPMAKPAAVDDRSTPDAVVDKGEQR